MMGFSTLVIALVATLVEGSGPAQYNLPGEFKAHPGSDTTARDIFNSIHAALRQWDSSIHHNGMSLFPAYIPEGTLFYHGRRSPEVVTGMEWLAFEPDHAELFTIGRDCPSTGCQSKERDRNDPILRPPLPVGYLHLYQTRRPLDKLLYIDGSSAAKTSMGTLDTQDLLLLNVTLEPLAEWKRGRLLCELGERWGWEGFVRMEAGFELVLCNFSSALDLISVNKRPFTDSAEGFDDRFLFEYMRAVSTRYSGIGASRVRLDYSSMISAHFYPMNLSNPDPSSKQPRLISSAAQSLSTMRKDLVDVLRPPRHWRGTNWQGVVDMIQLRYQDRLRFLGHPNATTESSLATINHLLDQFIDYRDLKSTLSGVRDCSSHYLRSVVLSTWQDQMIYDAIHSTNERICATLFDVRDILLDKRRHSKDLESATHMVQSLMKWLDWSVWKRCQPCAYDEVCFVASWPFGEPQDHFNPTCLNNTEMRRRHGRGTYWFGEE